MPLNRKIDAKSLATTATTENVKLLQCSLRSPSRGPQQITLNASDLRLPKPRFLIKKTSWDFFIKNSQRAFFIKKITSHCCRHHRRHGDNSRDCMMIAGHRLRRWQRNFFLRMHFPNKLTQKFSGW